MTFDLDAPTPTARDVDLAGGVMATLRPWTGLLASAAEAAVDAECRTYLRGDSSPETWGVDDLDRTDPVMFGAMWTLIETATRAAYRIERLNLRTEDGDRLPITRFTMARLFHRGVDGDGAAHLAAYLEAEHAV